MASSTAVFPGQSPVLCQLCEVDTKIQWKCMDCDLLLCTKCKDKIHSKVKTAEEHKIINIKDIGKQPDQDTVQPVRKVTASDQATINPGIKAPVRLELSLIQKYTAKFPVSYIQVSLDTLLWIGSIDWKKDTFFNFKSSRHLQKVKMEKDNLKIISSFNVYVRDIAITPSNDLILADETPKLKQIIYNSNKVTESNYCVDPYGALCVHVTRDNRVVVGDVGLGRKGYLYVMDKDGVHEKIYRHDKNDKPLFTSPYRITSTSTGTLCVTDQILNTVVMLGQGEVISVYSGHPNINSDKNRFKPRDVVSTSNDNIIVADTNSHTLHILNNNGNLLTYYNTQEIGIQDPFSLAFNTAGQFSVLYIGCSLGTDKGKLYKLTLTGC